MPRRYYGLLVAVTLCAAFLRLWQLADVPPGLHYDLAATALLGNDVAFNGYRPLFITAYTGHEPLYYYWLALWFRLIGSSVFALRLASALLGVLAVPATFFAVREVLRGGPVPLAGDVSAAHAALAAALLAAAFFHVVLSRYGFRVITQPVVQALALGFLFRGLWALEAGRRRAWLNLALGGAFTGLAAYTYLAARLFPVPLAVLWGALLLAAARAGQAGRYLRGLAAFGAAALVVFAPLGLYFVRHPEDFLNRAGQVAPRVGETALLLHGLRRAAEMVFIDGEPYDRFNLPGLSLLGPVLGFFFVVGVLLTLWNALRPWLGRGGRLAPVAWAAEVMLLAWMPAMLLPTALAVHEILPSNLRAFGVIPLLFVFPAWGVLACYRWLQRAWPGPLIPYPYPLALLILGILSAATGSTARLYFREWASLPNQALNNDADLTAAAAYLNQHDNGEAAMYVSAIHYRHPTLAYLARDFDDLFWLTGGQSLVVPAGRPALYVFARSAPPPAEWVAGWRDHLAAAPPGVDGEADFEAYYFEAGEAPPLPEFAPVEANFGNLAVLTGYRAQPEAEAVVLDLRWRIENVPEAGDYLPYARLYDAWGAGWSQSGGFSYPSEQWQPGDTVLTRVRVPLPAGLPPGEYVLKVGLYSAGTQHSLPRLGAGGAYAGDRAPLPALTLPGRLDAPEAALRAEHSLAAPQDAAGPLAGALLGYSLEQTGPRQGEHLALTLFWRGADTLPGGPITVRLGEAVLYAGDPVRGTLPLAELAPGQVLADRYDLAVPVDQPPGPAVLSVEGPGTASLLTLDVQAVDRAYDPPPAARTVGAHLGELAALHGYTLTPGPTTTLSLVWQALADTALDYTVFVHVIDANGAVAAQADRTPRAGAYPTSLWAPGEYITDDYAFDLPPGKYRVAVGLYLPETGERLRVEGGADAVMLETFGVQ